MWKRPIAAIACLLSLLLAVVSALADSPHRHIDGSSFANYLTHWVLKNTDPKVRRKDSRVTHLNGRLYRGGEFNPKDDPRRKGLLAWMLSRPDASISPDQLYSKAIQLAGGDVQSGLILVWDVLREGWTQEQKRNLYPHIRKLIDITGELDRFDGVEHPVPGGYPAEKHDRKTRRARRSDFRGIKAIRGDNFSAWYHFSGTALHAYVKTNSRFNLFPGKAHTRALILMEEVVLHDEFVDALKRRTIDKEGAEFGSKLAKNLKKYATLEGFRKSAESKDTKYIYGDAGIYTEDWLLKPGQHPRDYGTDLKTKDRPGLIERHGQLSALLSKRADASPEALVEYLLDPNLQLREMAAKALVEHLSPRIPALLGANLHRVREGGASEYFQVLQMRREPESFSVIQEGARNPSSEIRKAAVLAAGSWKDAPEWGALLSAALRDPIESVNEAAVSVLGDTHTREASLLLAEELGRRSVWEQYPVLRGLARRDDPESLTALLSMLDLPVRYFKDELNYRRQLAAEALRGRTDPASVPVLERLLGDPDSHVRKAAAKALVSRYDTPAMEAVARILNSSNRRIRSLLRAELGHPSSFSCLRRKLRALLL